MFARIICRSSLFELSPAHRSSWINSMALPNRRLMATENAPASDSASVISGALKEARRKVRGSETAPAKEKKLEARAKSYTIPASIKKLNDVASLIRGLSYNEAIAQLKFSPRRAAQHLAKVVDSARANAENTYGLNPDRLVVAHVILGRETPRKEMNVQHKGVGIIHHPKSNVKVILREVPLVPGEKRLGVWGRDRKFIARGGAPIQAKPKLKAPVVEAADAASTSTSTSTSTATTAAA